MGGICEEAVAVDPGSFGEMIEEEVPVETAAERAFELFRRSWAGISCISEP